MIPLQKTANNLPKIPQNPHKKQSLLKPSCSLKCESSDSKKSKKQETKKYKIALITTTRADWGLLSPLAKRLEADLEISLQIYASGTHVERDFGSTYKEILKDGFNIFKKIKILGKGDSNLQIAKNLSATILKFSVALSSNRPDLCVILGDRYEALGVGLACGYLNIPIAHICGGESTQGANDEYARHCLSKIATLHFATTDFYAKRIIQLGEEPWRVFNVGSLAVENIKALKFLNATKFAKLYNISEKFLKNFCILTYHSETLESDSNALDFAKQAQIIIETLLSSGINVLATKANADANGQKINAALESLAAAHPAKIALKDSLGKVGYLSAVKLSKFVIGNSSSGISEVPLLGRFTINIGERQKGRYMPKSVLCVKLDSLSLKAAINTALNDAFPLNANPFGDGTTSTKIHQHIKTALKNGINLRKRFYDLK